MCNLSDGLTLRRVLIVEDHDIVRRGLTELLNQQPDLTVCAAVASAEEALELMQQQSFDLAIVDISLGRMDGLELTGRLKQRYPGLIVLILSMHEEHVYAERLVRAGASGFVAKQEAPETVLLAIAEVLNGRTYYHPVT